MCGVADERCYDPDKIEAFSNLARVAREVLIFSRFLKNQ